MCWFCDHDFCVLMCNRLESTWTDTLRLVGVFPAPAMQPGTGSNTILTYTVSEECLNVALILNSDLKRRLTTIYSHHPDSTGRGLLACGQLIRTACYIHSTLLHSQQSHSAQLLSRVQTSEETAHEFPDT